MDISRYSVSVIIPIFNVENYIERCLHSLFSQTLENIEYVFVNDATPDRSMNILNDVLNLYPFRKSQVKIITHKYNRGVAAARTTGIKAAGGEYIIHCDPDDYVESDMYEKLFTKALDTNADIVTCDHYRISKSNEIIQNIFYISNPQECLVKWYNKKRNGNYAMLWDKLVRRKIIEDHKIYPFENIDFGEDFGCVVRFFYYSKSIVSVHIPLYHYCKRQGSYTETPLTLKTFERRIQLVDIICDLLQDSKFKSFCLNLKFNMKLSGRKVYNNKEKIWYNLYKETHKHILSFRDNSLKSRILWLVALSNFKIYYSLKKNLRVLN